MLIRCYNLFLYFSLSQLKINLFSQHVVLPTSFLEKDRKRQRSGLRPLATQLYSALRSSSLYVCVKIQVQGVELGTEPGFESSRER